MNSIRKAFCIFLFKCQNENCSSIWATSWLCVFRIESCGIQASRRIVQRLANIFQCVTSEWRQINICQNNNNKHQNERKQQKITLRFTFLSAASAVVAGAIEVDCCVYFSGERKQKNRKVSLIYRPEMLTLRFFFFSFHLFVFLLLLL